MALQYDRSLLLRDWYLTAKQDPQKPPDVTPADWLQMHGLGEYASDEPPQGANHADRNCLPARKNIL